MQWRMYAGCVQKMMLIMKATELSLFTNSACVHEWILDTLSEKASIHTKALTKMFIQRRLSTLEELINKDNLSVSITLVKSNQMSQRWLETIRKEREPMKLTCAILVSKCRSNQIRSVYCQSGHPSVRQTLYLARWIDPAVSKARVKTVVSECQECQSIISIMMAEGKTDVGEGHYSLHGTKRLWFHLIRFLVTATSARVMDYLKALFFEQGSPAEILTGNTTTFCSKLFRVRRVGGGSTSVFAAHISPLAMKQLNDFITVLNELLRRNNAQQWKPCIDTMSHQKKVYYPALHPPIGFTTAKSMYEAFTHLPDN